MHDDWLSLAAKLRKVDSLDDLAEVKQWSEQFIRKEKRSALLTLLAIGEEFGDEEIFSSLKKLSTYLEETLKNKSR